MIGTRSKNDTMKKIPSETKRNCYHEEALKESISDVLTDMETHL